MNNHSILRFCLVCMPLFVGTTVLIAKSNELLVYQYSEIQAQQLQHLTNSDKHTPIPDSLTKQPDSLSQKDTDTSLAIRLPLYSLQMNHGQVASISNQKQFSILQNNRINRRDFQTIQYTTLTDVLEIFLPALPRNCGFVGQTNHLQLFGSTLRDVGVLYNTRPILDRAYGFANLEQFPLEFLENVELFTGSEAVVFSENASGFLLNIQEPIYNTLRPYTRIWYQQAGYDQIHSDGTFAQNIARNVSMTLGYRRISGDGRFANQRADIWNVRGAIRWIASPRITISYSHIFTNHGSGQNGGVDTLGGRDSQFDELRAQVRYQSNDERVFRHDGTSTVSINLDDDTTSVLKVSTYFSTSRWEKFRSSDLVRLDTSNFSFSNEFRFGTTVLSTTRLLSSFNIRTGGNLEYSTLGSSAYYEGLNIARMSGFGYVDYTVDSLLQISGGVRLQTVGRKITLSIGGKVGLQLSERWKFVGDISQSSRLPSPIEFWSNDRENITMVLSSIQYRDSSLNVNAIGFFRYTNNPLVASILRDASTDAIYSTMYSNGTDKTSFGGSISASWKNNKFKSTFTMNLTSDAFESGALRSPLFYTTLDCQYAIFKTRFNEVSLGFRVRAQSAFLGESYIPMSQSFVEGFELQPAAFNGLDFNAFATIGNAFIKLSFQNILSSRFTTLSTFPELDRNIRLSVAWTLYD